MIWKTFQEAAVTHFWLWKTFFGSSFIPTQEVLRIKGCHIERRLNTFQSACVLDWTPTFWAQVTPSRLSQGQSRFKGHLMTEWEPEGESNKREISVPLKLREHDVIDVRAFLFALIGRFCGADVHLIDFNSPLCSRHTIHCSTSIRCWCTLLSNLLSLDHKQIVLIWIRGMKKH